MRKTGLWRRLSIIYHFSISYYYLFFITLIIRMRYGNLPIIFNHGSVGDVFFAAILLDQVLDVHGKSIIIYPSQHQEILKRCVRNANAIFIPYSENKCQRIRAAWIVLSSSSLLSSQSLRCNFSASWIPCHIVLYPEILRLVRSYTLGGAGMHYISGLRTILSIPQKNSSPLKSPAYYPADLVTLENILGLPRSAFHNIAFINPICYTAKSLPYSAWLQIGRAISSKGFVVIFNSQGKAGSENHDSSVPRDFINVKLPAFLCPLVAEKVGMVCGRDGGGFNLLHSFIRPRRSLLILFDHLEDTGGRQGDPPRDLALKNFSEFNNYGVDHVAVLASLDAEFVVYEKTIKALNTYL